MKSTIDINEQFQDAIKLIDTRKNVFVTGKAGTGKSTLLRYILSQKTENVVTLAPTGVAAVNIAGQTIHSFFRFRPDITVEKVKKDYKKIRSADLYNKMDLLIIDEISMVRADLFDCMDTFLRMHGPKKRFPFGGVQLLFFGDLYQLPPVVTYQEKEMFTSFYHSPYFFDAIGFSDLRIEIIELEKIYRQRDETFIRILNGIRNRSIDDDLLSRLNRRVESGFVPAGNESYIYLVTTNKRADEINLEKISRLKGKAWTFDGKITGEFDRKTLPAPEKLTVKVGAQVMLTNNDRLGRWINGTVGQIEGIKRTEEGECVRVKIETGDIVDVWSYRWDMFRYVYRPHTHKIESETTGTFTQFPMILAWAITIHKSQGKTFERMIVDMGSGAFAHGQTYVAISRATNLTGLVLIKPIERKHLLLDYRVVKFLTGFRYDKSEKNIPLDKKIALVQEAIAHHQTLVIEYLKANDEKSERRIHPKHVGTMEYLGKSFMGVRAYDELRGVERVFRLDRMLSLQILEIEK